LLGAWNEKINRTQADQHHLQAGYRPEGDRFFEGRPDVRGMFSARSHRIPPVPVCPDFSKNEAKGERVYDETQSA
jgi:hypothetical protein